MNWWNQSQHLSGTGGRVDATQPVPAPATATFASHLTRGRAKALRWTAGILGALVVAACGAVAGLDLGHSGSPGTGQAAVLSAALGDFGATQDGAGAAGQPAGIHAVRALRILRHLRGIHGEFTMRQRGGGFREIAYERGVITAIGGARVAVRAADGTTWTWRLTSTTVVVKDRAKAAPSSLWAGDQVFAGGAQSGTVRDARLIVVPVTSGKGGAGSAASSPASSAG